MTFPIFPFTRGVVKVKLIVAIGIRTFNKIFQFKCERIKTGTHHCYILLFTYRLTLVAT